MVHENTSSQTLKSFRKFREIEFPVSFKNNNNNIKHLPKSLELATQLFLTNVTIFAVYFVLSVIQPMKCIKISGKNKTGFYSQKR